MSTLAMVLLVLALALYAGASALFVVHLLNKKLALATWGTRVLLGGMAAHFVGKIFRFVEVGAVPVTDSLEALSLLALVLTVVFVFVARRYSVPALGAFAAPLALVALAASLAFGQSDGTVPEALRSAWFPVHLGFAITADALFTVAGIAGVAYLIQERMLRKKKLTSGVFRKLPPLHVLDEIAHRLVVLGLAAMTVGMAAGALFAKQKWGAYWSWDPKQSAALLTWLLFAGILHFRLIQGWQGRRIAMMTAGAAGLAILSIVFLQALFGGRHGGEYT